MNIIIQMIIPVRIIEGNISNLNVKVIIYHEILIYKNIRQGLAQST